MIINEHLVKVSGTLPIESGLDLDGVYAAGIEIEVNDSHDKSNKDGTFDKVWVSEITKVVISQKTGEVIKSKDRSKQSQLLRAQIELDWEKDNQGMSKEGCYKFYMGGLRHNWPEVKQLLLTLNKNG